MRPNKKHTDNKDTALEVLGAIVSIIVSVIASTAVTILFCKLY